MSFIYLVDGQMGAGKTSFISLLAHQLKARLGENVTLWSNYGLEGARPFRSFWDFLDVAKCNSSVICVDEAQTILDSRLFGSKNQVYMTQLLLYLRKLRTTMLFSTVRVGMVDVRIREIADVYVRAEKRRGYVTYEFWDLQTGKQLRRVQMREDRFRELLRELDLFKTWQPVSPIELPELKDWVVFLERLKETNRQFYERLAV